MTAGRGKRRLACIELAAAIMLGLCCCTNDILNDIKKEIETAKEAEKPKITSFSLVSPAITNSSKVRFTLAGSTTIKYWLVRGNSSAPGADDNGWETTAPSVYTLSAGAEGRRSIYAWAKSDAGVLSDPYTPITVTLDTVKPTITGFALINPNPTFDPVIPFTLTGSDASGSGISAWFVKEGSTTPLLTDTGWSSGSTAPLTYTIPSSSGYGTKFIYAWARDGADNLSDPLFISVDLQDSGIPTITTFSRTSAAVTNDTIVTFTLAGSANIQKWLVNENDTVPDADDSGWSSSAPSSYTLSTSPQGSRTIYAWAKTQYDVVSDQYTPITVTLDTVKPTVTGFSLTSAYHTDNRDITISLAGSDATGGISGWFLKENDTTPGLGDAGWSGSGTPPTTHQVSAGIGTKSVYAWARDTAGNISNSYAPISVDLRVTPAGTLTGGTTRVGQESIVVTFNDTMTLAKLTIGGDIGTIAGKDLQGGVTLTLSPPTVWPKGSGKTLTITGTSEYDIALIPFSVSFTVDHRIYVNDTTPGSDSNIGSSSLPKASIAAAISIAAKSYGCAAAWAASTVYPKGAHVRNAGNVYKCVTAGTSGSTGPSGTGSGIADGSCAWDYQCAYSATNAVDILVAQGTYSAAFNGTGPSVVVMTAGASLYGGYSDGSWSARSPSTYITTISDTSSSGGEVSSSLADRAVYFGSGVTTASVLDGCTVTGGSSSTSGSTCAAILCEAGSPTISNCTITGGLNPTAFSDGILAISSSSPVVTGCTISGGTGASFTSGIEMTSSSPTISGNTITTGTTTGYSRAVRGDAGSPLITGNWIHGGNAGRESVGIYAANGCAAKIYNNTISGGKGGYTTTLTSNGIYAYSSACDIRNNTIDAGAVNDSGTNPHPRGITIRSNSSNKPILENNIIFVRDVTNGGFGIYEYDASSDPADVKNNDIFDCTDALYRDEASTSITTIAGVNGLSDTTSSGNVSVSPTFTDRNNYNWHLISPTLSSVYAGGLILSTLTDFPQNGLGHKVDKDNNERTPTSGSGTGWSIGAYEMD